MIPKSTILESRNYAYRIPNQSDLDFVYAATCYPYFNAGMKWSAPANKDELFPFLQKDIDNWQTGAVYNFTIVAKGNKDVRLGRISLRKIEHENTWHVGFWTHPEYQKKGIGTEALSRMTEFAFKDLGAETIRSRYATWNKASEKVLFNNGFRFVRHIEQGFQKNKQWVAENEVSLSRADYAAEVPLAQSCDFCKRLEQNNNTVFENDQIVALLDIDPISLGHVLICPKKHYDDFHDMPDMLISEMMLFAKKYIQLLRRVFPNNGYSMMLNGGAFNDLGHCHLHLFPRNFPEEFQWTYSEAPLSPDAGRFEVIKKLLEGYI